MSSGRVFRTSCQVSTAADCKLHFRAPVVRLTLVNYRARYTQCELMSAHYKQPILLIEFEENKSFSMAVGAPVLVKCLLFTRRSAHLAPREPQACKPERSQEEEPARRSRTVQDRSNCDSNQARHSYARLPPLTDHLVILSSCHCDDLLGPQVKQRRARPV